jgi:hypothetical protein
MKPVFFQINKNFNKINEKEKETNEKETNKKETNEKETNEKETNEKNIQNSNKQNKINNTIDSSNTSNYYNHNYSEKPKKIVDNIYYFTK